MFSSAKRTPVLGFIGVLLVCTQYAEGGLEGLLANSPGGGQRSPTDDAEFDNLPEFAPVQTATTGGESPPHPTVERRQAGEGEKTDLRNNGRADSLMSMTPPLEIGSTRYSEMTHGARMDAWLRFGEWIDLDRTRQAALGVAINPQYVDEDFIRNWKEGDKLWLVRRRLVEPLVDNESDGRPTYLGDFLTAHAHSIMRMPDFPDFVKLRIKAVAVRVHWHEPFLAGSGKREWRQIHRTYQVGANKSVGLNTTAPINNLIIQSRKLNLDEQVRLERDFPGTPYIPIPLPEIEVVYAADAWLLLLNAAGERVPDHRADFFLIGEVGSAETLYYANHRRKSRSRARAKRLAQKQAKRLAKSLGKQD